MTLNYTIQVLQEHDDQWYWRLLAPNHLIVATGMGYNTKGKAVRAAKRLIAVCREYPIRFGV